MANHIFKALPLAILVTLGSGCANTAKMDEVSTTASAAQKTADEAKSDAAAALKAAQQAQKTAEQALKAANEAKAASAEANTKIDRAFKKAMSK